MGHDEHFLSRLDRVEYRQVEFALALYNDAELVKFILARAKLPEGAERVALSLQHPIDGPFVIVTREGKFVTCLGEGMSPKPHPVITRQQVDAITEHAHAVRDRTELAVQALQRHGHVNTIVNRLHEAGEFMSREEMAALVVWQPVLWNALWDLYIMAQKAVIHGIRMALLIERPAAVHDGPLKRLWLDFWCCAHTLTLLTHQGAEDFHRMLARLRQKEIDFLGLLALFHMTGAQGFALRGAWCAARLHKHILPSLKNWFRESPHVWVIDDATLGLTACAAAHTRYTAEIAKVVQLPLPASPKLVPGDISGNVMKYRFVMGVEAIGALAHDEDEHMQAIREVGRPMYARLAQDFPTGHPHRITRPEEIPDEFAATALLHSRTNYHTRVAGQTRTTNLVPVIARLPLEQLYFPREVISGFVHKWDSGRVLELIDHRRTVDKLGAPPPKTEAPMPGRNDPCHCGSGKKFKKCCAP